MLARAAEDAPRGRAGQVGHRAVAARRTEPTGNLRSASRQKDRRRHQGDLRRRAKGVSWPKASTHTAEHAGLDRAGAVGGQQRGRPRARHLQREDRLPPRPHARASVDRRHRLPRLPAGTTEIPRHVSILPGQWPGRGGFLGDQFDAFKTFDPQGHFPTSTARVRRAVRPSGRDLDVIEKTFARGRQRKPETQDAASPHRGHAAQKMMDSRAAQGVRRAARAEKRPRALRRHALRTRLPGGAAAGRSGRAVRRGDAWRLGQPRQQPRYSQGTNRHSRSGPRGAHSHAQSAACSRAR